MEPERDTADLFEDAAAVRREVGTEEEHELALFFNDSLDLLCIAGFDGHFKRLNPAWTIRLGWSLEELQIRPFLDFVHSEDRMATQAQLDRHVEGSEAVFFENRFRHRDGSYRWLRWLARPLPGRRRVYAIARDVTRQKQLEREVLEILDREKERLGRELHDGLGQTLAGIAGLSAALTRRLVKSTEDAELPAAAEITRLLNEAIGEARDLARGLGPLDLEGEGLDTALAALALRAQKWFRGSCTFARERALPGLGRAVASHLYRIAQEALGNALSHGKGARIEIRLGAKGGDGILTVRDDGRGMPEAAAATDGIGMYTMAYRARRIGGSLEVRRRRPRGTAVICTFPLPDTADTVQTQENGRDHT